MRRLAARLPTPASHARLRRTIQVSRSGIAAHVSPSRSTASSWCARPRWLKDEEVVLPQRRWMVSPTTPLSQDLSSSSPVPPPPPTDPPPITHSPPLDEDGKLDPSVFANLPFRFDTGIALFAKRTPRPFPPPFLSPPSGSFSDPLSTHDRSRDRRRAYVDGHLIQGFTNGDDAVFASDYFICANDGVGAWSTRPRGHAGLWARLILHFWATAVFEDAARQGASYRPDPVGDLQRAYEQTIEATGPPNDWQGTTTVAGAQLHYRRVAKPPTPNDNDNGDGNSNSNGNNNANANASSATNPNANGPGNDAVFEPVLYVTNLGDSQVMVIRPSTRTVVYKSVEQWHWFDCPRQLGTNSPDTPRGCAVVDEVALREGDVVLAMSDGVIDNLWAHEIVATVCDALERWTDTGARGVAGGGDGGDAGGAGGGGVVAAPGVGLSGDGESDSVMGFVAEELMEAARTIAVDPFAESPFMEHAIEEGLASGGGKLDDISVVAAICRRNGSG